MAWTFQSLAEKNYIDPLKLRIAGIDIGHLPLILI